MKKPRPSYQIEPQFLDNDGLSIYPSIQVKENEIEISLAISRKPNQESLYTNNFEVELIDSANKNLPSIIHENKKMVEVGGGLGGTSNGRFLFRPSNQKLKKLTIIYQQKSFEFQIKTN